MNGTNAHWRDALLSRFAKRQDIGKEVLYARYFEPEGLPKDAVFELFDLIEFEYQIPAGLLRPEDKLTKLFEPVATKNPWRWLVYQVKAGDIENELSYQLARRMRQHGTYGLWPDVETVGELTRAWCGQKPR